MYERRRQAASPVSLLAVTFIFVWACSSGGQNEDSSVTASGGAGSRVAVVSGSSNAGGAPFEGGAPDESASAPAVSNAGSEEEPPTEPTPTSGAGPVASAGSSAVGEGGAVASRGGTDNAGDANDSNLAGSLQSVAGAVASAGSGVAGAPVVVEPTCSDPQPESTDGLFLPCDVAAAFSVCRTCHSNPPVKPLKSSYVTYQDIKPVAAQIYGVIKSGYMPWPPYKMSPYAQSVALKWLGKDGSCAIGVDRACQ